ncbi:uncharacterized protein LOC141584215 [Saimiri boliviensis]|uniref:uncharacterized protein LOC141584215 n=1 Tax=Saimiri boliviensis TaxID=27679 RepID=UPI003D76F1CA
MRPFILPTSRGGRVPTAALGREEGLRSPHPRKSGAVRVDRGSRARSWTLEELAGQILSPGGFRLCVCVVGNQGPRCKPAEAGAAQRPQDGRSPSPERTKAAAALGEGPPRWGRPAQARPAEPPGRPRPRPLSPAPRVRRAPNTRAGRRQRTPRSSRKAFGRRGGSHGSQRRRRRRRPGRRGAFPPSRCPHSPVWNLWTAL